MMGKGRKPRQLSDIDRFCICGYLATGDASTAYVLSHGSKSDNPESIVVMASKWINRPEVQEYIENRRRAELKAAPQSDKGIMPTEQRIRSKEDVVAELNALADAETDFKRKADYLMKLAEIQRMKQVEETEREKQVTYYLPMDWDTLRELWVYKIGLKFGWSQEQKETAYNEILYSDPTSQNWEKERASVT